MNTLLLLCSVALAAPGDIPDARVVLPWSDFKALYEKGQAPQEKPENAPQNYTINRATYVGKVVEDGEAALFDVKMQVQVHKSKGWITVPLAPTSVALRSAKMGGKDAPIFLNNGWYTLVTDAKGVLSVDLQVAAQVFEANGVSSLSFPMAPSGGTEVVLEVPGQDELEFTVGQARLVSDTTQNGVRRLEALLPAVGTLGISWQREVVEDAASEDAAEARRYAEVHTLLGVSEGVLSGHSDVNYTIVHKGVETLTVSLPADVTVLDVTGSGIREWTSTRAGEQQTVRVDLNFEALGAYKLMLDYERVLPEGSATTTVPVLTVGDVERVKGFVGVAALSTLEVLAENVTGARRVDVRELPASVVGRTDQPVLLGYKFRQADWTLPLRINQHEDIDVLVTIVDTAEAITMVTPDGKIMSRMSWHVRNNRRQFLRLDMPEGAEIWSVNVAGKAVKPARDEQGQVLVPLVRSKASGGALAAFTVEVVWVQTGVAPDERGRVALDLALAQVDVPVTYARWSVYLPWEAKVRERDVDSSMRLVEYFSTPVTPEGEYLDQIAQQAMAQSYDQQQAAVEGGVAPVDVAMPVDGQPLLFEELLIVNEPLTATIGVRGL